MTNHTVLSLISGLFLLLYGVKIAGEGFQRAAGPKLRQILYYVTSNRLVGVTIGALVTAVIQSSSATTVMIVGFVSSGLINLAQAVGVVLGANIGTTFTVQLIAFKIYDYAVIMVGIGAALVLFGRKKNIVFTGQGILGFALIFLSMKIMSDAMIPMKDSRLFREILLSMEGNTIGLLLISTIFTGIVQSSAATIGVALALSLQGLISIDGALPIILGANVGTCITAALSAMNVTNEAKKVAVVHVLFNVLGVIVFLPLLGIFRDIVFMTSAELSRQIANAHTFFNFTVTILFIPFTTHLARLADKVIPEEDDAEMRFKPKYLNVQVLESPDVAFGLATREALRMADIAQEMFSKCIYVIIKDDQDLLVRVEEMDDQLDILDKEIKLYITKISQKALTEGESKREVAILTLVNDLENIGDIIDKNIMELAKKKISTGLSFSTEGQKEIIDFFSKVADNFEMAISAFATGDSDLAWKVLKNKEKLGNLERELKAAHISRLHKGLKESIDTSSIHLDLLSNLKRINHHIINISYPLIGIREEKGE
ncbi:MAG: Na/Pi cotransporter family protein [Deltaproteobacteria bacterium]|nr:Na/Pi cotransporter family protein [Deltaproteobacteria bacterium]